MPELLLDRPDLGREAADYARFGWPVFRLRPDDKRPFPGSHGFKEATTGAATIERWWAEAPDANVGMPTGAVSGLVVLDVDDGEAGEATLAAREAEHGTLPPTLTARTPGEAAKGKAPGRQLYFAHPGGRVKSGAGDESGLGPHLDVRGDGGYVVLPPSSRPDGAYTWIDPDAAVAELPTAWAALLRAEPKGEHVEPPDGAGQDPTTPYGAAAVAGEAEQVASAPEGQRNDRLNRAAFKLGQLAAAGEVNVAEAVEVLVDAADGSGLLDDDGEGQTRATIRSGLRAGLGRPRLPRPASSPPPDDDPRLAFLGDVNARRVAAGREPLDDETLALARDVLGQTLALAEQVDRGEEDPPPPQADPPGDSGEPGDSQSDNPAPSLTSGSDTGDRVTVTPGRRTVWTAAELLAADFPEPRWAVPGIVPEGVTLLVGAPKLGKSWLALGIGEQVAAGGVALGSVAVEQGEVLYLALEDPARRLKTRLATLLDGRQAPYGLTIWTECPPLPEGGEARIRAWLDQHPAARLGVVDVFTRVRGEAPRGVSAFVVDYRAVAQAKAIADDYGVALVLVHHDRKAPADDFLATISGTSGLAAAADTILVLKRARGEADAVLHVTGRDVEEAERALRFTPATGAWTLLSGPVIDFTATGARGAILRHLRGHGAMTPLDLADALDLKPATARQTCRRMAAEGQLGTDGAGRYWAPPT